MNATAYDTIILNGTIYDGYGGSPFVGDVAINGDTIAAVGPLGQAAARHEIDATALAVAPGFINMLSWANESLIEDGCSQSDIRQGVTLEVMGEGWSMGPLNEAMKVERTRRQGDIRYAIEWTTLGEYLDYLVRCGVSPNVASFVGSSTVRIHVLGHEDRAPTPDELRLMQSLVREAMEEGAMGLSSALIYAPACYAAPEELIALAWKHPNVYIDVSAHLPRYLDPSIINFMNTRGRSKCLFGTNGIGLARCKEQFMELSVKDETKQAVLRDNAIKVFKL